MNSGKDKCTLSAVHVVHLHQRIRTGLQSTVKTKASIRSISLSPQTITPLRKHRSRIAQEKLQAGELYRNQYLVVCTSIGTPTNSQNLNRTFYGLMKKAEVERIRFHGLRHTHASLMLMMSGHVKVVSERLGHADSRITFDTYEY